MNWAEIFDWPDHDREVQSIPKRAFLLQERISSAEKKLLQGTEIQSIKLLHSVKQSNSNIPVFESDDESYLEILFIVLKIAETHYEKYYKPAARLIHKLLPHHCLVITIADDRPIWHISLCTKNIHPNNPELRVLKKETFLDFTIDYIAELLDALSFSKADKVDLKYFYNYYLRVIQNFNLISLTGSFRVRDSDQTHKLLNLQSNIKEAESNIRSLISQLKKETQMREKVRINTEIYQEKTRAQQWKNMVQDLVFAEG